MIRRRATMKTRFGPVIGLSVISVVSWVAWTHLRHVTVATFVAPGQKTADKPPSYSEQEEAKQAVPVWRPLGELLKSDAPANSATDQPASQRIVASDHVGPSPVGTERVLLHRTFRVTRIVDQPFDLPPHAFNPQLHGRYRAFPQGGEEEDESSSVQFLLLSEEQYANLLSGRPAEALLTADGSEEQEINFRLPPTFEQAAKYHLVFKDNSKTAKEVVRADFRIEF